jgi:hypothetical protein
MAFKQPPALLRRPSGRLKLGSTSGIAHRPTIIITAVLWLFDDPL